MKRPVGRLLSLLLLSMLGTAAMGEEAVERYIVVLRDRFSPAATQSERARPVAEPDIAALGGRVLQSRMNRRLVELPSGKAEELRGHPDVAYMQRVWDGVSAPEAEPEVAAMAAPARAVAHDTTPGWTTGTYSYDPSGNIRAIGGDVYSYDTAGRLLQSRVSGQQDNYAYDAFGNLFNPLTTGKVDPATNRLRDTANPAKWPYSQAGHLLADAEGRPYLYDALGMVNGTTASDGERRMIYTADDERIAVVSKPGDLLNEVTRVRVRNFGGQVLREFTRTSTDTEWTRDYVYADGRLVGGERQVAGTQTGYRHFHLDHLGSTRLITRGGDAARITDPKYLPFGGEIESSTEEGTIYGYYPLDPIKFTGHERDYLDPQNIEGGDALDYMHARYYDGGVGRFLTVDPVLQMKRAMKYPQLWNRYSYALNNPLVFSDPTGTTVYVVTYTTGNEKGDDEFRRAALTRAEQIKDSKDFDATRDTVLVRALTTREDYVNVINEANSLMATFGRIGEFNMYSHGGKRDGPIFQDDTPYEHHLAPADLNVAVNWEWWGSARFYGCNTGLRFTQTFASAQGVAAWGYKGYANFSSTEYSWSYPRSTGPLYLIHTTGGSNGGFWGSVGKWSGMNDLTQRMVAAEPEQ
jgi:RHS repeat-associated protein